ncbi:uncharacterized protein LOC135367963 [Ornithodoros turicata]|uniref:uncharacterized protein LOC135367963 n=1 Tax=Ornithodoros turicata TaxID=34597 RepID=UPI00313937C5
MKTALVVCVVLAGVCVVFAGESTEGLCALDDTQKAKAVECITGKVSDKVKEKWEGIKASLGDTDLEAAKKLCELKQENKEAAGAAKLFTPEDEAEIKKAFNDCKPQ